MKFLFSKSSKYSLKSLQGKIVWGFMISLMISTLTTLWNTYKLDSTQDVTLYYWDVLKPIKFYTSELSGRTSKMYSEMHAWVLFEENDYRTNAFNTLSGNENPYSVLAAKDSIDHIKRELNSSEAALRAALKQLDDGYERLERVYSDMYTDTFPVAKHKLILEMYPVVNAIRSESNIIIHEIEKIEVEGKTKLSDSLWWSLFYDWFILFITSALVLIVGYQVLQSLNLNVKKINLKLNEISNGALPIKDTKKASHEFDSIYKGINQLIDSLKNLKLFATEVGAGNFTTDIEIFEKKSDLGNALYGMKESLWSISDNDNKRKWQAIGVSKMSSIIRINYNHLDILFDSLLEQLIDYTGANQGAIYIADDEGETLEIQSTFAYGRKRFKTDIIETGHGLVGEVFRDSETLVISNLPKDYLSITSGLGKSTPRNLIVLPMSYQDTKVGVIEVASFKKFEQHEIDFYTHSAEIFASTILNALNRKKTETLLGIANKKAEDAIIVENDLQNRISSLITTRSNLENTIKELKNDLGFHKVLSESRAIGIIIISDKGKIRYVNKSMAERTYYHQEEMIGMSITMLMPGITDEIKDGKINAKYSLKHYTTITKSENTIKQQAIISGIQLRGENAWNIYVIL